MFLRFNRLMQSVGITTPVHDTTGKFIDNQNLVILYHIILVFKHQVVGAKCEDNIMLNLQILRIRKVIDMEIFLHLFHTLLSQIYSLFLFIDDKVSALLDFLS